MSEVFLSPNLKFARTCLQETQKDFSDRLKIALKKYQSYEKDGVEPPYSVLLQICETLGLTADQLLSKDLTKAFTTQDLLLHLAKKRS